MRGGDYPNAIIVLTNALKKVSGEPEIQKDLAFTYICNGIIALQ